MLKLLKYQADGGREAFARYGAVSEPPLAEAGASVVYATLEHSLWMAIHPAPGSQ